MFKALDDGHLKDTHAVPPTSDSWVSPGISDQSANLETQARTKNERFHLALVILEFCSHSTKPFQSCLEVRLEREGDRVKRLIVLLVFMAFILTACPVEPTNKDASWDNAQWDNASWK